ncbi:hypothetical protein HPB47_011295 [Ixodes persulcatus]|uniref:Uncharacterized protein n=1 Tax=Ixodes persulcatus TaxID=34615 RepID=A0AC60NWL8_IXOPE|nr:hypothetical protein HPB47_011295 [Ixodes persulcatus]
MTVRLMRSAQPQPCTCSTSGNFSTPAGGTCESRCLVSGVTTDPEPCGFARPRLAVRGFPVSGEKGILVVESSPGCQGVTSEDDLLESSEEKILEGLSGQGGTYAEVAARGAAPPPKATVGTQYSLRDLECSPSPPTTSEASVGSQTPVGPPKVPRAKTVPHRPGPKPRVVPDATPSQSSEGPTPSTSQREEEAMEVSADPTEPPPPVKGEWSGMCPGPP